MRRRVFATRSGTALLSLGFAGPEIHGAVFGVSGSPTASGRVDLDALIAKEASSSGQSPGTGGDVSTVINKAIADAPDGAILILSGEYLISRPIWCRRGNLTFDFSGRLRVAEDFSGDFAIMLDISTYEPYFKAPVRVRSINLDCSYVSRGIYARNIDHAVWNDLRIDRPRGFGLLLDRIRESQISGLVISNGVSRTDLRASSASVWSSAVQYHAGDVVARIPDIWQSGRTYDAGSVVSFDNFSYVLAEANLAETSVSPEKNLSWRRVPIDYYQAVRSSFNHDPRSFNLNNLKGADRVWRKIYLDEAAVSINDDVIDGADRSNQVTFVSPVIRDCGHLCYVRLDSNKGPWPLTHINFLGGHIHNTFKAQDSRSRFKTADFQRMVEIGRCININFYAVNIRATDSDSGVCVLIGDQSLTKRAVNVRFRDCVMSGKGFRQTGMIFLEGSSGRRGSISMSSDYVFTGDSSIPYFSRLDAPSTAMLGSLSIVSPCQSSARVNVAKNHKGSASEEAIGSSYPGDLRLGFSDGGSSLEMGGRSGVRIAASESGLMSLVAKGGVQMAGEWDNSPLVLGSYFFWVSSNGELRVKRGRPSFEGDGSAFSFSS